MTLRDALGGRWATHWFPWLALYVPTTLIVMLRESTTEYPAWWWPLLSATVQHLLVGVVILGGGALLRRRWPVLPLWVVFVLWEGAAVLRGVLGGGFAEAVAGVDGDHLYRVLAWVVSSLAWVPALVYAIAQIDRRRGLLGELDEIDRALAETRADAAASSAVLQARLASLVRASVEPVLDDLQRGLAAARADLAGSTFSTISRRLSQLHDDMMRLVRSGPEGFAASTTPPTRRASVRTALDVRTDSPWITAALVVVATLTVAAPDVGRTRGVPAALEVIAATFVAGIVLGVAFSIGNRLLAPRALVRGETISLAGVGIAIIVATAILVSPLIDPVDWHGVTIAPILAMCLVAATTIFIATTMLNRMNDDAEAMLQDRRDEFEQLETARHATLERERERLAELMHGPVQGRLSACVMALNFFAGPGADPDRLAAVSEQVLDHLAAASRDLALLAGEPDSENPPNGRI